MAIPAASWDRTSGPDVLVCNTETACVVDQVVVPALSGRVKIFGNLLALKDEWQCVDAPYFTAPGWHASFDMGGPACVDCLILAARLVGVFLCVAHRRSQTFFSITVTDCLDCLVIIIRIYMTATVSLSTHTHTHTHTHTQPNAPACFLFSRVHSPGTFIAPIGAFDGPIDLPPVTMVFSSVEGGKSFGRRESKGVHQVIASAIQSTIRAIDGGYCCRMQEVDLKYMTVFSSSQVCAVTAS